MTLPTPTITTPGPCRIIGLNADQAPGCEDADRRPGPRPELALRLVVAGRMSIEVGHRPLQLRAATLCWTFPDQRPSLISRSKDLDGWLVHANRAVLALIEQSQPPPQFHAWHHARETVVVRVTAKHQRWLYDRLAELSELPAEAAQVSVGLAYVLLRAWELTTAAPDPVQAGSTTVLAASKMLKDPKGSGNWSTTSLAQALGVSPGHLERRFRAETGTTITQFRLRAQIDRYLDLCDDDHLLSITDAAFQAGFGSYAQFYRVFQRLMGTSPSSHRTNRRKHDASNRSLA